MENLTTRADRVPDGLTQRAAPVTPTTFDKEKRSLEVVMTTENPVEVYSYEYGRVRETLLMSGAEFGDRIPLCDTHDRYSSDSVLGSVTDIRIEGDRLIGRAYFSSVENDIVTKIEEGHLTDFSVGYSPDVSTFIPGGTTETIGGRAFTGPLLVTSKWQLKELSVCPIGADKEAKARAELNTNQKENVMDEKTRQLLIKRGLPENATEDQAWAYLDDITRAEKPEPKKSVPEKTDVQRQAEELDVLRAERTRADEILAMGEKYQMPDEAKKAIREGQAVDTFRASVLETVTKRQTETSKVRPDIIMGLEDKDKFRAAAEDGLLIRCGKVIETPRFGGEMFAGYSLRELARECLVRAGQRPPQNIMEMVSRSLTTSDFPILLSNVANKNLFEGYETAEETWRMWCGVGSVSDFKNNYLMRVSETDDLEEVPESAEYQYGDRTEEYETYKVVTFGKMMMISRQAVINDDLGALSDVPRAHGEAAARKIGDLPYDVLIANAVMGDGVALFNATHLNVMDNAAISVDALNAAVLLMKSQTDIQGLRRLNIRPQFVLAPVAMEGSGEQFFNTGLIGGVTNSPNLVNTYTGTRFTRVYEPRLDDDDTTVWYLAGPKGKTVNVFFLNGQQAPYLESRQGFTVDGIEYKVRIDAGAKAVDWKALVQVEAAEES